MMITPTWKQYQSSISINGWLGMAITIGTVVASVGFVWWVLN